VKVVGRDLQAGRYMTAGSQGCYWARRSGTTGQVDEILANDNTSGPLVVDILLTDVAFESSACATWTPYQPPPSPTSTFGDGTYVVGEQIAAGTYQATPSPSCYWARHADATGGSIVANDNVDGSAVVTLEAGDIFQSARCGTWRSL
jgi:hypothetical protein